MSILGLTARRGPHLVPALALALGVPGACGGNGPASATRIEAVVDTVDGVPRTTFPESGAADLAWRLDTTAVIGGFTENDPDYQFGRLTDSWLASDAAGTLYVYDSDGTRVLGYDADGALVGRWGREGGGPGEIGGGFGTGAIAVGPGDTLWIADRPNQRFTLIPLAGGEPTSVPMEESAGPGRLTDLAVNADGALGIENIFVFGSDVEELPPRNLVRIGRGGAPSDTLWRSRPRKLELLEVSSGSDRVFMMNQQRFEPEFSFGLFSDGAIALRDRAEYLVHVLDRSGETELLLRREPPPRATSDADREAVIESILAPPEEGDGDDAGAANRRRTMADAAMFAPVVPWIVELRVDGRDRLWLGVSEDVPGEVARIDVYTRDGTFLGELRETPMPDHFLADGRAAMLSTDELDVQQIHLVRVVEEPDVLETAGG